MIHTPCKDCCFANYEDNTQVGCKFNLLDEYEKLGHPIREVYDDDKEFYVVEGRKCVYCRTNDWFAEHKDNYKKVLEEEMKLRYTAIIYAEPDKTFEDVKHTLFSLFNSSILPTYIIITYQKNSRQISNKSGLPSYSDDLAWCQQNCRGIKFSIEYPSNTFDLHQVLNITLSKFKNQYILLEAGKELRPNTIQEINDAITEKLHTVVAAKHQDNRYHELFCTKSLHNHIGGFGKKTVQEKIDEIIEDTNKEEKGSQCTQMFLTYR